MTPNAGLSGAKLCAAVGSHKWRAHNDEIVWCVECGATEKILTQRDRQIESLLADNVRLQETADHHLTKWTNAEVDCDQLRARIGELEQALNQSF